MPVDIRLKRAYEPASPDDGERILVERLWPRGVSREEAALAGWMRELSPSPALRRWYGHDPERWPEFRSRYLGELEGREEAVQALLERVRAGRVTFVLAARNPERSSAAVLKEHVLARLQEAGE